MHITPLPDYPGAPPPKASQTRQVPPVTEPPPYSAQGTTPQALRRSGRRGTQRENRGESRGYSREGGERRQHDRRQNHVPVMLDTRSKHERRSRVRRGEDGLPPAGYARRRGISVIA